MSTQASAPLLLLVDDDDELAGLVATLSAREGIVLARVDGLGPARAHLAAHPVDLVLLDVMLPDGSGLDLCRELRVQRPGLALMLLTARGDPLDRVVGLELGADDYLAKPFEGRELVARARALLRRTARDASAPAGPAALQVGALAIDLVRMAVRVGRHELLLPGNEFRLLVALARRPGEAMSREAIAAEIQPGAYRPLDRAIDVQVARLRRKLRERLGVDPVHTVRGAGYALLPPAGER